MNIFRRIRNALRRRKRLTLIYSIPIEPWQHRDATSIFREAQVHPDDRPFALALHSCKKDERVLVKLL